MQMCLIARIEAYGDFALAQCASFWDNAVNLVFFNYLIQLFCYNSVDKCMSQSVLFVDSPYM